MQRWWKRKKHPGEDDAIANDTSRLVDKENKLEASNPPLVAATFTHSILVESESFTMSNIYCSS